MLPEGIMPLVGLVPIHKRSVLEQNEFFHWKEKWWWNVKVIQ